MNIDTINKCNDEIVCSVCERLIGYYDARWVDGSFDAVCKECKNRR